jgi:hypothetical protein
MAQLASRAWVRLSASNVGSMPDSHQGLCAFLGFFCLTSVIRGLFVQCLSLVQVFRSSLHVINVCDVTVYVVCIVCELSSACTRLGLEKK